MAIFGIGAFYDQDVSSSFVNANLVGVGWSDKDAPELHQFMMALKVGDIVYIKSFPPGSKEIIVKAIGIVIDDIIRTSQDSNNLVACGRNVRWASTQEFRIIKPQEKNNVRSNTMYEEYHPEVQKSILTKIVKPSS